MTSVFSALSVILNRAEKRRAFFVLLLTILVALIEVLGVASILPFMAVVTNTEVIQSNPLLAYFYDAFHFQNN